MSQKPANKSHLKNTLSELDSAVDQWNSITNKPVGEQVTDEDEHRQEAHEKARSLLKKLQDQLDEFEPESVNRPTASAQQ